MLIATFSAAASFSHVSAIRSAVARLMVVKSWICSAALPLTTNSDGTFCANTTPPRAVAPETTRLQAMRRTLMSQESMAEVPKPLLVYTRIGQNHRNTRLLVAAIPVLLLPFAVGIDLY